MSLDVDDILADPTRRKGVKSGAKGKRKEREICKILNARFLTLLMQHQDWGMFSRSVGSGNRWGQKVQLSKNASDTFSGDITPPTHFKFVLESKGGYNDIDLNAAFDGGHREIDEFLQQVSDDSARCGRQPMLIWRKDRRPGLAFIKSGTIPPEKEVQFQYTMKYRDWTAYFLDDVLTLDDDFFFNLPVPVANPSSIALPLQPPTSP
jgi:hypothetical protein